MTVRGNSVRRRAEVIVLEAARAANDACWDATPDFPAAMRALRQSLIDLDAMPMELPGQARVRKSAPLTAHQAAVFMDGTKARNMAGDIVRLLYNDGSVLDHTSEEIEHLLGAKHHSVSARMNELENVDDDGGGWIFYTGRDRATISGVPARVMTLTPTAIRCIEESQMWG